MTIYNAYLVKGHLLDKNAPPAVIEAIEAVIASLRSQELPHDRDDREEPGDEQRDAAQTLLMPPPTPEKDGGEEPRAAKKKREWSPEARAAAAERLRVRQAAGLMKRRGSAPGEAEAPSMGGA